MNRMFLDWCPWPRDVVIVDPRLRSVVIYDAPSPPTLTFTRPGNRVVVPETVVVDLNTYAYPQRGRAAYANYGWHEKTRTVLMHALAIERGPAQVKGDKP